MKHGEKNGCKLQKRGKDKWDIVRSMKCLMNRRRERDWDRRNILKDND